MTNRLGHLILVLVLFAALEAIHLVNTSAILSLLCLPCQLDSLHCEIPPLSFFSFQHSAQKSIRFYHKNAYLGTLTPKIT